MTTSKRMIFRKKALQQYIQNRDKTVLLRIASPPVFLCLWLLLLLFLIAGITAWFGQVPIYAYGSGIIAQAGSVLQQRSNEAAAVIFVPASPLPTLRTGLPARVWIGSTGPQWLSTVAVVEPGVISPSDARQHYGLGGNLASIVTQPSRVVIVKLALTPSAHLYAGSIVQAQVQVGTQRALSLLPGLGTLFGGQ